MKHEKIQYLVAQVEEELDHAKSYSVELEIKHAPVDTDIHDQTVPL